MAVISIVLLVVFGAVCIGLRTWIHVQRTGRSPFLSGPGGNGILAVVGFSVPFVAAAVVDLNDSADRIVSNTWLATSGIVLAVAGVAGTMWSQLAMGDSWRVGIDPDERTRLVTWGPYRRVRNPIYTGMFVFAVGLTLLVPNVVSLVVLVGVVAVVDVVVQRVEEPYLERVHGAAYQTWAATTGRFLPRLGR